MGIFTSMDNPRAPHIFDVISDWPEPGSPHRGTRGLPEGWTWLWAGEDWVVGNGKVGLTRADWFIYKNKQTIDLHQMTPSRSATREEVMAMVDTWPTDWNKSGEKLTPDWVWVVLGGSPVIINQVDNVNSGTVITESEWREYLVDILRENQPLDPATAKQATPKGSGNPILGMVLTDLTNRALEGKEKYGEPLLAHNGRNPLWDAYQEALDLAMYLRQAIEEQSE